MSFEEGKNLDGHKDKDKMSLLREPSSWHYRCLEFLVRNFLTYENIFYLFTNSFSKCSLNGYYIFFQELEI